MNEKSILEEKTKIEEKEILEGWKEAIKNHYNFGLTPQEEYLFKQAQLAEEHSKKIPFVLGEPLHLSYLF